MIRNHLTIIFAALFVLFGLPMLATDDEQWARFWAGLSAMSLGAFALALARDALRTGTIRIHSVITHAAQPRVFWATVALVAAAGLGVIVASFSILLIPS